MDFKNGNNGNNGNRHKKPFKYNNNSVPVFCSRFWVTKKTGTKREHTSLKKRRTAAKRRLAGKSRQGLREKTRPRERAFFYEDHIFTIFTDCSKIHAFRLSTCMKKIAQKWLLSLENFKGECWGGWNEIKHENWENEKGREGKKEKPFQKKGFSWG